ncbi:MULTISPECIES: acyl-CoA desaturase [unclassified Dietzia]|uniref:fatty acid desaturase family protein n=1 Tax=unclassified Dietzia TaxID=2617939 RepID=UPI000D21A881|nr:MULTISPECIES: acyl-CoA desaturase [unclassified Dietzia]AVZ40524.1 acyl-CoA desaturase [Dietzia sp. JS16-p6b]QGW26058.1 fatty acid desaturase [Dietzia sp. DQ12-45-1b]
MAITDIPEFAHLTEADIEALGEELEQIRQDIIGSLGERDAAYIRNTIRFQRALEVGSRALLMVGSRNRTAWAIGAGALGLSKIIENMELGHNIMHGQWDWMNDPEVHSTTWEWDIVGTSEHWKQTHNYIHHKYTNIVGLDDDVGYGVLRVTRDQRWHPYFYGNLVYNAALALLFQWGVGIQHLELGRVAKGRDDRAETMNKLRLFARKAGRQLAKDYLFYPALSRRGWKSTLTANLAANGIRNVWTNAVIFCGHFPDGAEKFTKKDVENETRAEWYLRQMLGSANITGGPVIDFLSGNLSYQIEHHIYPDMSSNRLAEASVRVREVCRKYDLPYVAGPLPVQYFKAWRTIAKMSLPDHMLRRTADDAPETHSERMFADLPKPLPAQKEGQRAGLQTALRYASKRRARKLASAA